MKFHSIECLAITSIMISIKHYTKPKNLNSAPKWTETIRRDRSFTLMSLVVKNMSYSRNPSSVHELQA